MHTIAKLDYPPTSKLEKAAIVDVASRRSVVLFIVCLVAPLLRCFVTWPRLRGWVGVHLKPCVSVLSHLHMHESSSLRTFLLPPVMVTFTKRRVYEILFFARPLGVFFFSWGSTYG